MVKKLRDLSFSIILIFLIAVGMYWIMEQLQKDYLPQYISLLGEKLISMVHESSDKYALSKEIEQLKKDYSVNPKKIYATIDVRSTTSTGRSRVSRGTSASSPVPGR